MVKLNRSVTACRFKSCPGYMAWWRNGIRVTVKAVMPEAEQKVT
jgi:hypothetical protein